MLRELAGQLQEVLANAPGTYGVSLFHFESGESFEHQAEELFFAASVIKVPIMCAVFDEQAKGTLTLAEKMTVRYEDMAGGSGILQNLSPGVEMSIHDLTTLMIIESDNTATNMLIDRLGVETIQQAMRKWGLTKSRFYNKLMVLPAEIRGYNEVTAGEMTHLLRRIAEGKIVSWKACREMVRIMKQQKFLDGIASQLPEEDGLIGAIPTWEIASKTGWTSTVTHDMGLLYLHGNTVAVTILSRGTDRLTARGVMGKIGRLLYDTVQHK
jgi:beta-lactamase class A